MNNELQSKFYKSIKEDDFIGSITQDVDQLNQGNFYTASKLFTAVADDGFARLRIKASTTKSPHVIFSTITTGKCYLKSYAGTTYTDNGTEITPFNRNLTVTNTSSAKVYHTPTIDVAGTQRAEELIGSGHNAPSQVGGVNSLNIKTILDFEDDLLIEVQNKAGSAQDICIIFNYFEE